MTQRSIDGWLFNGAFAVYLVYKAHALSSGRPIHFLVDGYLADLVALPVILPWCEALLGMIKRDPAFRLSGWMVVFGWLYTSLTFEVLLPLIKPTATGDVFDAVAYGIGALGFWRVGRG